MSKKKQKTPPPSNTITLDLDKIDELANFSSEVLTRLAFFGTADKLNKKERAKAAHRNLDTMNTALHKQLKERFERYQEEYDNIRGPVSGCDTPDPCPEQVGH